MTSYGTVKDDAVISDRSNLLGPRCLPPQRGSVLQSIMSNKRLITSPQSRKSFVYTMLNPRSKDLQAKIFKWFITFVIVADLFAFIMSTDREISDKHAKIYKIFEAVDSTIFLIEYILRLVTVTESTKYGNMGQIKGRLRYMFTVNALVDAVATFPYFIELCFSLDLPTLTYLRSFRLLRILKTNGFSEAIKSVCRVFRYNSEILLVAVWIGVGLVLVTAVLMYYLRPRDEDNPQFKSLPATIYLSTLMLTGQGGPDGALPWYTSTVVLLTGIFSIGMFAIPASMLTWGFEGEAERLAKLRRQKLVAKHNCVIKNRSNRNENMNDNWSYSSEDYSTDEEYLNTIAGFEVSDDDDKEEEREGKRNFRLADIDRSGTLSLTEFLKLSRELKRNEDIQIENIALANILESLFRKVDDNSKKLELICSRLGCTSSAVNCTDA